ncbi:hypothetical protein WJX73_002560 [Symbiochloris irregularis]|uniref:Uroporphyrinogen-III synthase n=1 Tax=Symbiochloris irregularis TaxID=706552 RepID=A0AAW1PDQ0_9CHLO
MPGAQLLLLQQRPHCAQSAQSYRSGIINRQLCCRAYAASPKVVLTREKGKNKQLQDLLEAKGISSLELPLVESAPGPDRNRLPTVLRDTSFDWIVITSPEAAAVFLEAWKASAQPEVTIAVVGSGTGRVLTSASSSLQTAFTPSKANGKTLAAELPERGANTVLYPSSAKAGSDVQDGLSKRGFKVTRLNTYDTLPVKDLDPDALALAKQAAVVAVASPSAVSAWLGFVGKEHAAHTPLACIGSTSAERAQSLGLHDTFAPDKPGMDGFVTSILQALESQKAAV